MFPLLFFICYYQLSLVLKMDTEAIIEIVAACACASASASANVNLRSNRNGK
jgi:hypothetical protein